MDPRYKPPDAPLVEAPVIAGFRDIEQWTKVLTWMLMIGAGLAVVSAISSAMQLELLSRSYDTNEAAANDKREALLGGATVLLTLGTMVVFGRWIVLAHRNLEPLGVHFLDFTPGWAVGWFFIPIANLWKPYQAMRFLWRGSHDSQDPASVNSTWLLPTWWTFWIISSLLGNFTLRFSMRAQTVPELQILTVVSLINCIIDIGLFLIAALMVRRIWKAQLEQALHPVPARTGFADAPP